MAMSDAYLQEVMEEYATQSTAYLGKTSKTTWFTNSTTLDTCLTSIAHVSICRQRFEA